MYTSLSGGYFSLHPLFLLSFSITISFGGTTVFYMGCNLRPGLGASLERSQSRISRGRPTAAVHGTIQKSTVAVGTVHLLPIEVA